MNARENIRKYRSRQPLRKANAALPNFTGMSNVSLLTNESKVQNVVHFSKEREDPRPYIFVRKYSIHLNIQMGKKK